MRSSAPGPSATVRPPTTARPVPEKTESHWPLSFNITYEIAAGVDARIVADRVGHRDVGYLIKRYAHAVAAAQESAGGGF